MRFSVPWFIVLLTLSFPAWLIAEEPKPDAPKTDAPKADDMKLTTDNQKASYGLGSMMGRQLKEIAGDIDLQLILKSAHDSLDGKSVAAKDKQIVMNRFMEFLQAKKAGQVDEKKQLTAEEKTKIAGVIGETLGKNLQMFKDALDFEILSKAFISAAKGEKPVLDMAETQAAVQKVGMEAQTRAGARNKAEGEAFLAENKKKEGVVTTPSGLQYKILTEGKGDKPADTDTVTTNYKGTFIDGRQFDSSYDTGEPVSFPVTGVIKGWTEALKMMTPGSKWQLFIPSDLAYGPNGRSGIPPNSTLLFDIELLKIEKPAEPKK